LQIYPGLGRLADVTSVQAVAHWGYSNALSGGGAGIRVFLGTLDLSVIS
jgi:hypothetical protein